MVLMERTRCFSIRIHRLVKTDARKIDLNVDFKPLYLHLITLNALVTDCNITKKANFYL